MAGSAILGDNLIDDLAPDIDDLRTDLYADFHVPSESLCQSDWA